MDCGVCKAALTAAQIKAAIRTARKARRLGYKAKVYCSQECARIGAHPSNVRNPQHSIQAIRRLKMGQGTE